MYTMESKNEFIFINFLKNYSIPFVICELFIACDLSYATKVILVANVVCD